VVGGSKHLPQRAPAGDEGNRRLHQRWVGFLDRRKRPVVANVAIAREREGFIK